MDTDWEVEIGGGAPVIETNWSGFVDLCADPTRIHEIPEAGAFPPLANLLKLVNAGGSSFWTSKCDLWQPDPLACACYIDVLPRATSVYVDWHDAESFCRACVDCMRIIAGSENERKISIDLCVRAATAGEQEGFGITAYLSAKGRSVEEAKAGLAHSMDVFADALLTGSITQIEPSTLK